MVMDDGECLSHWFKIYHKPEVKSTTNVGRWGGIYGGNAKRPTPSDLECGIMENKNHQNWMEEMMTTPEPKSENLAETENFFVWKSDEPDGEVLYHLEWNQVTLSFFQEEWDEFLKLIGEVLHPAAKK